jgi:3-dehydroquinate synthase
VKRLEVELKDNSYPIYIKSGLYTNQFLDYLDPLDSVAIITNDTVASYYLETLQAKLADHKVEVIRVPDSEQAKSFSIYESAMTQLLEAGLNRSSALIALGGGVVGDLTGFLAATLHRGCRFIQIPTTLLAQVDSSVGGKTGINHPLGKNLVGAFYQPEAVLIDPECLKTLDDRQFSAGMAEVIKYGFIEDDSFFTWLEQNKQHIKAHNPDCLTEMIYRCCAIKADVVAVDEKEQGKRALLNYGHTFGHAIEQVAGYGQWLHGEAVSVGMLMAMRLAINEGLCPEALYPRLEALLTFFKLPVKVDNSMSAKELTRSMLNDKKNLTETLRLILPEGEGRSVIVSWQDLSAIEHLWQEYDAM